MVVGRSLSEFDRYDNVTLPFLFTIIQLLKYRLLQ